MKASIIKVYRPLELLVVLAVLGLTFGHHIGDVQFHGDESQWIATSRYFEALVDKNYAAPSWLTDEHLDMPLVFPDWAKAGLEPASPPSGVWEVSYWTLTQPPMARYVIALGRLAGGYHAADLNAPWNFSLSASRNMALGTMPSRGLLGWSRGITAVLAVLSGMILFLLLRHSSGPIAGYAFVSLYAGSPYLLTQLRRAMGESTLLLFTCLTMLAAAAFLASWSRTRIVDPAMAPSRDRYMPWIGLIGVGLGAGLAGATKLHGLALALAGVALCFVMALGRAGRSRLPKKLATAAWTSAVVVLVAVVVFIAVNPFLYPNPPARTAAMITLRNWELTTKQFGSEWGIRDLSTRMAIVPKRIFVDYMVFRAALWNAPLFALGLFLVVRRGWRWLRGNGDTPVSMVILIVGAVTAVPALFTPLDWDRYYLYPVIFVSICIAVGIGESLQALYRRLRRTKPV